MPASSGSYNFQSISAELIIREAYERIGILGDFTTAGQLDSATRSINFLLTDWSNRNINLWTLRQDFISLQPGIKIYTLPIQTQKIIQCELRESIRRNTGEGGSYDEFGHLSPPLEGQASYIFGDNPLLFCLQNSTDGYFSFDYGVNTPTIISFVGIQSNIGVDYNITIDGSTDGNNWITLRNLGVLPFQIGINQWFELNNVIPFRFYRIKENDGAVLNIQKVYFNNFVSDTTMTEVSRYEYLSYPKKNMLGRPTVYFVNYDVIPTIYIWQNPTKTYNCMFYSAQNMIQTLTSYVEAVNIPSSFYQPLVYGLAKILAEKYAPDKAQMMQSEYEQSLGAAVLKNTVEVPLTPEVYG